MAKPLNKTANIGKLGEKAAANFLNEKGYLICEKNYHSRFGEIDIIASDNEYIIFVEVKTRNKNTLLSPMEYVNKYKRAKIIKTALIYLSENTSLLNLQPRFDVIEILTTGELTQKQDLKFKLRYIKNAFFLEENNETF